MKRSRVVTYRTLPPRQATHESFVGGIVGKYGSMRRDAKGVPLAHRLSSVPKRRKPPGQAPIPVHIQLNMPANERIVERDRPVYRDRVTERDKPSDRHTAPERAPQPAVRQERTVDRERVIEREKVVERERIVEKRVVIVREVERIIREQQIRREQALNGQVLERVMESQMAEAQRDANVSNRRQSAERRSSSIKRGSMKPDVTSSFSKNNAFATEISPVPQTDRPDYDPVSAYREERDHDLVFEYPVNNGSDSFIRSMTTAAESETAIRELPPTLPALAPRTPWPIHAFRKAAWKTRTQHIARLLPAKQGRKPRANAAKTKKSARTQKRSPASEKSGVSVPVTLINRKQRRLAKPSPLLYRLSPGRAEFRKTTQSGSSNFVADEPVSRPSDLRTQPDEQSFANTQETKTAANRIESMSDASSPAIRHQALDFKQSRHAESFSLNDSPPKAAVRFVQVSRHERMPRMTLRLFRPAAWNPTEAENAKLPAQAAKSPTTSEATTSHVTDHFSETTNAQRSAKVSTTKNAQELAKADEAAKAQEIEKSQETLKEQAQERAQSQETEKTQNAAKAAQATAKPLDVIHAQQPGVAIQAAKMPKAQEAETAAESAKAPKATRATKAINASGDVPFVHRTAASPSRSTLQRIASGNAAAAARALFRQRPNMLLAESRRDQASGVQRTIVPSKREVITPEPAVRGGRMHPLRQEAKLQRWPRLETVHAKKKAGQSTSSGTAGTIERPGAIAKTVPSIFAENNVPTSATPRTQPETETVRSVMKNEPTEISPASQTRLPQPQTATARASYKRPASAELSLADSGSRKPAIRQARDLIGAEAVQDVLRRRTHERPITAAADFNNRNRARSAPRPTQGDNAEKATPMRTIRPVKPTDTATARIVWKPGTDRRASAPGSAMGSARTGRLSRVDSNIDRVRAERLSLPQPDALSATRGFDYAIAGVDADPAPFAPLPLAHAVSPAAAAATAASAGKSSAASAARALNPAAEAALEYRRPAAVAAPPTPQTADAARDAVPQAIDPEQLQQALKQLPQLNPDQLAEQVYKALARRMKFDQRLHGY